MHGILKEDLYQLQEVVHFQCKSLYSLQQMRDTVDNLTNKFTVIPKGTKFNVVYRQLASGNLIWEWISEDGSITNKDSKWADRYLEQYEEKGKRINIHGEEFSLVMCFSPSFVNSTFYRKIGILMGNKKRVLCLNDKNLYAWITTEENYNFTDNDEQLRFNKFLDTVKSFT